MSEDWPFEPKESDRTDAQKTVWDGALDGLPSGEGVYLRDAHGRWTKISGADFNGFNQEVGP